MAIMNNSNNKDLSSVYVSDSSIDKLINSLQQVSRELSQTANNLDTTNRGVEKTTTDLSRNFDNDKVSQFGQKTGEMIGSAIKSAVEDVLKSFSDTFISVTQSMMNNYDTITAKEQLTRSEYYQSVMDDSQKIIDYGYQNFMSIQEQQQQLMTNEAQGLRGQIARDKSITDLITKKLVPEINTNTRSSKDLYKMFGDNLQKQETAFAMYAEKQLGSAEGLSEGLWTGTKEQFADFIRAYASTSEQASQMETTLMGNLMSLASTYGEGAAQQVMQAMYSALTQNTYSDTGIYMSGISSPITAQQMFSTSEGMNKFISDYMKNMIGVTSTANTYGAEYIYGNTLAAYYGRIFGKDYGTFESKRDELMAGYNPEEARAELEATVQTAKYGVTAEEQVWNELSNWWASTGLTSTFNNMSDTLQDIKKSVVNLANYFTGTLQTASETGNKANSWVDKFFTNKPTQPASIEGYRGSADYYD